MLFRSAESNQKERIQGIDWLKRIVELEAMVKTNGWKFNLIYNSGIAGTETTGGNQMYYNHTMDYINAYKAKGGDPDGYWIQSWYHYPNNWLSESSDFTMTNLTKAVLEKVKK